MLRRLIGQTNDRLFGEPRVSVGVMWRAPASNPAVNSIVTGMRRAIIGVGKKNKGATSFTKKIKIPIMLRMTAIPPMVMTT